MRDRLSYNLLGKLLALETEDEREALSAMCRRAKAQGKTLAGTPEFRRWREYVKMLRRHYDALREGSW